VLEAVPSRGLGFEGLGGSVLTGWCAVKRSPLKRGAPLPRGSKLTTRSRLPRGKRLRQVGKRGRAIRKEIDAVREAVLERAAGACERCGSTSALHLHHIQPRSRGGAHHASNLVALCSKPDGGCHGKVHAHSVPDWRRWVETRKAVRS
jgi:5-methylcytosine-specific restriction endonuclease McrA